MQAADAGAERFRATRSASAQPNKALQHFPEPRPMTLNWIRRTEPGHKTYRRRASDL